MRIVWTHAAQAELRSQIQYIAVRNKDAARRIRQAVHQAVLLLADNPSLGRLGDLEQTRELVITGTPYLMVYGVVADEVQIYHLYHGRQDWRQGEGNE